MKAVAVLLLVLPVFIYSGLRADYMYGEFTEDWTVVFNNGSPVYSGPDIASGIIAELPAGEEVDILGCDGEVLLSDSFRTYWYKVDAETPEGLLSGYMTGVDLAMASVAIGGDTLMAFNVTGYDPETYAFSSSARLYAGVDILDEVVFRPVDGGFFQTPYRYSIRCTSRESEGLTGVRDLFELSFIYEACGFLNRDVLFAWTGSDLIMGPEADNQFEASEYRFVETFITPPDSGGIPEQVMVVTRISEWCEETEDYQLVDSYVTDHRWTGTSFIPPDDD